MVRTQRSVAQRMSRRLLRFLPILLLVASSAPASPIAEHLESVERIRGLSFDHAVRQETIDRAELPLRLRQQMEKSLPYSTEDYGEILRVLQFVDADSPHLLDQMFDLYQAQVLAYY